MKLKLTLTIVLLTITALGICYFLGLFTPEALPFNPAITNQSPHSTTISWTSKVRYAGTLFFQAEGKEKPIASIKEKFGPVNRHEVTLDSLTPGTRYSYWLKGSETKYQFLTMPSSSGFFSFLIISEKNTKEILSHYVEEMPEWILIPYSIDEIKKRQDIFFDHLKPVFPFISVIHYNGHLSLLQSPDSDVITAQEEEPYKADWTLSWGGLDLTLINTPVDTTTLLNLETRWVQSLGHTRGIMITQKELLKGFETTDAEDFPPKAFHQSLLAFNTRHSEKAISFVLINSNGDTQNELNDIMYVALPLEKSATSNNDILIRIDVHPESVTAAYLSGETKEIALKKPPMQQNRTCADCRRLADQGAYKESIEAYKTFIANNQNHFQVDDALFAIAELYDTKLFDFTKARMWYEKFNTDYPKSSLVPLSKQRISYLDRYADFEFKPLARFEQIKRVDYVKAAGNTTKLNAVFERAQKTIDAFPNANISPVIQYWLANQLRSVDYRLAVKNYNTLLTRFPASDVSKDALFEIGETLYQAKAYKDAIKAFEKARSALPKQTTEINIQIDRAKRNIRRKIIAFTMISLISIFLIVSLFVPPLNIRLSLFRPFLMAFLGLSALYSFGSWLIHEQFSSQTEWVLFSLGAAFTISFGYPISKLFTEKLSHLVTFINKTTLVHRSISMVFHIIFVLCGGYILLYFINEHYLVMINM